MASPSSPLLLFKIIDRKTMSEIVLLVELEPPPYEDSRVIIMPKSGSERSFARKLFYNSSSQNETNNNKMITTITVNFDYRNIPLEEPRI